VRLQGTETAAAPAAAQSCPGLVELASGIDALYLSGRGDVPAGLLEDLEASRVRAEGSSDPERFSLGDLDLIVQPRGWGKYRYSLDHEHARFGLTTSVELPPLRVQPRSEFLHAVGPDKALSWVYSALEPVVNGLHLSAARLDLYADWQGWELAAEDRTRFACRARRLDTHEEGDAFTGIEFGRRKTGTITARIYDKTRQVEHKGLDWWTDVWGSRYDGSGRVLRVEFELGRQGLRQFGVESAMGAISSAPGIWKSLTANWLSYRDPSDDQTRSRWPVAAEWLLVSEAEFAANAVGLERIREAKQAGSLRKLMPLLSGVLASFGALVGAEDVEGTIAALPGPLHNYGLVSKTSFAERVERKALRVTAA
jgi:hypothetical protein